MTKAAKLKLIGVAVLAVLAVIIILQNTAPVTTKILFAKVELPRAILLIITLIIGYACGILTSGFWTKKH